jgi:hypothetical protein
LITPRSDEIGQAIEEDRIHPLCHLVWTGWYLLEGSKTVQHVVGIDAGNSVYVFKPRRP